MRISYEEFRRLVGAGGGRCTVPDCSGRGDGRKAFALVGGRVFSSMIPLEPRVKKRPRVFAVSSAGKGGAGGVRWAAATPKGTRRFEKHVRDALLLDMHRQRTKLFTTPIVVGIRLVFGGAENEAAVAPRYGDLDNLEKAVLDAMNKSVFLDDRLVVAKFSQKAFGEMPLVHVLVAEAAAASVSREVFGEVWARVTVESGTR